GFGRRVVEPLKIRAHVRSQVTLIELDSLEGVDIHDVDRTAQIDEDSANFKVDHVYSNEKGDIGIR
ncbi:hypothetical protein A2U01_0111900, partial [Trifolium medium]|nr:hypothetical protein [Trifolium medium]